MALTYKQQKFVEEYLVDLNAAAAYRRAGYKVTSDRAASAHGARLVANGSIAAAIAAAQAARSARTAITADTVLRELARLGFSDARRLFGPDGALLPVADWPDDVAAAVASVEVLEEWEGQGENRRLVGHTKKLRLWDKNSALEKLGKHLRLFVDRLEVTGRVELEVAEVVVRTRAEAQAALSAVAEAGRVP